jgi:hypothetical protein
MEFGEYLVQLGWLFIRLGLVVFGSVIMLTMIYLFVRAVYDTIKDKKKATQFKNNVKPFKKED